MYFIEYCNEKIFLSTGLLCSSIGARGLFVLVFVFTFLFLLFFRSGSGDSIGINQVESTGSVSVSGINPEEEEPWYKRVMRYIWENKLFIFKVTVGTVIFSGVLYTLLGQVVGVDVDLKDTLKPEDILGSLRMAVDLPLKDFVSTTVRSSDPYLNWLLERHFDTVNRIFLERLVLVVQEETYKSMHPGYVINPANWVDPLSKISQVVPEFKEALRTPEIKEAIEEAQVHLRSLYRIVDEDSPELVIPNLIDESDIEGFIEANLEKLSSLGRRPS